MKQLNKVMALAMMLFISGQAVASSRGNDLYAQYGMTDEAVGSVAKNDEQIRPRIVRPVNPKAATQDEHDQYLYKNYGIQETEQGVSTPPESWVRYTSRNPKSKVKPRTVHKLEIPSQAVDLQETAVKRTTRNQPARQSNYVPVGEQDEY